MKKLLQIQPVDPIITRDGRPFGETPGAVAHSMDELSPSVLAGTIRTLLGKLLSDSSSSHHIFRSDILSKLMKAVIRGPLYRRNEQLFYPLPKDISLYEELGQAKASIQRPNEPTGIAAYSQGFLGTGKDGQYEEILWPVSVPDNVKSWNNSPAFISEEWMIQWLSDSLTEDDWARALGQWQASLSRDAEHLASTEEAKHFMSSFVRDIRTHVAINPDTYSSKDQALFTTESLVIPPDVSLVAEVEYPDSDVSWPEDFSALHTIGGKRRLAHFREIQGEGLNSCPNEVLRKLDGAAYVRMVLTTPAYFAKGWLPGWLDKELQSTANWNNQVQLQLRWACVPRWQPVSGWSYAKKGEKAVRRMVPAGSVYFFQVKNGNPRHLAETLWLKSVSDANRRKGSFDHEDGFGLALWGVWEPEKYKSN